MSVTTTDVVVIGGGIIGSAVARELALRGKRVTVLDRERPGLAATWAAGGMLSPLSDATREGPFLDLAAGSLDRYPEFVEAVEDASGLDVEYRTDGKLVVASNEAETDRLAASYRWQRDAGQRVEWHDAESARRLEPNLGDAVQAAVLLLDDHRVDNRRLGHALWAAAGAAGARYRIGVEAVGIERSGGTGARVEGVRLADGERIAAEQVVVAAGAWSGRIQGLPRRLPVIPVRGEMIAVRAMPPVPRHVIEHGRGYLIPRGSGRLLIGATAERAGFRAEATAGGVAELLPAAIAVVPALAEAPILESWAGLRPGTPDDLPILGEDDELPGLVYATGHFRNGILLAPITAELIADLMTDGEPALPLEPFAPGRFAAAAKAETSP